jgi:hypothetical protein
VVHFLAGAAIGNNEESDQYGEAGGLYLFDDKYLFSILPNQQRARSDFCLNFLLGQLWSCGKVHHAEVKEILPNVSERLPVAANFTFDVPVARLVLSMGGTRTPTEAIRHDIIDLQHNTAYPFGCCIRDLPMSHWFDHSAMRTKLVEMEAWRARVAQYACVLFHHQLRNG